jgi:hypothetical protein
MLAVTRTWLSIRVDLISGHGEDYWPRPGRIFAAGRSHNFGQLAATTPTSLSGWRSGAGYERVAAAAATRSAGIDLDAGLEL